jgi:hypothetical protein
MYSKILKMGDWGRAAMGGWVVLYESLQVKFLIPQYGLVYIGTILNFNNQSIIPNCF